MKYPYKCETCGRDCVASAAYKLRHRPLLCLGCRREVNGWRHLDSCAAPPDHHGPCDAVVSR